MRTHWCLVRSLVQSGEAGKAPLDLDGPPSKTIFLESVFDSINEGIRLRPRQRTGKVTHHFRIGIQVGKRLAILELPPAQHKTIGNEMINLHRYRPSSARK